MQVESEHGERALAGLLRGEGIDPQAAQLNGVRRALELLADRMQKDVSVPRFLNTVLGFELGVQEVVVGGFFKLWLEETARAKLDGTYSQAGILNLKGEKVEVQGRPTTYVAPPLAEEAAAAGNGRGGRGGGRGRGNAAAAAAAPAPAPAPGPARGGAVVDEKEEREKQKLTVVTLSLDRGLSYGHALQMLLLATAGGSGERGGSGFYLPQGQPGPRRPLLALQRADAPQNGDGDGPNFKVLWPDVGREAYMDRTQKELLEGTRFLAPQEAEPLWTQRYEGALTTCAPHGGTRCCSVGKRLKTCHLLTFNLVQHWQRVKAVVGKGKKRMRVVRAETTAGASSCAWCLVRGVVYPGSFSHVHTKRKTHSPQQALRRGDAECVGEAAAGAAGAARRGAGGEPGPGGHHGRGRRERRRRWRWRVGAGEGGGAAGRREGGHLHAAGGWGGGDGGGLGRG